MLSDSGQLLGRPPVPGTPAISAGSFAGTPQATPGRSVTPSRKGTPGDLAPLALAPVRGAADVRARSHGHLSHAPPLPAWPSGAAVGSGLDARQGSPLRTKAATPEHDDYEVRLRSLGVRQDGFEQRLVELAGLFAGMTEEQNGHARQLEDLCDECRGARNRLSEVEDMQKYMVSELKVLTTVGEAPGLQKSILSNSKHAGLLSDTHAGPAAVADRGAGGARKDEVLEIRQDVRALGQALAALRDRVSAGGSGSSADAGQPTTSAWVSQLGELGRRVDAHGRRLLALTSAAFGQNQDLLPLRRILCEWHALLQRTTARSPSHGSHAMLDRRKEVVDRATSPTSSPTSLPAPGLKDLRSSFSAMNLRVLEHDQQLTQLHSSAQSQELHLAKLDSALETLLCQAPGVLLQNRCASGNGVPSMLNGEQLAELLEMVSGQAKAVDDLDFVVRDELRKSREQLAESEVSQQLIEHIVEQGHAIRDLHGVVEDISCKVAGSEQQLGLLRPHSMPHPTSPSDAQTSAEGGLAERLLDLEDTVSSMQGNLSTLAAVVRHVQDHAADALDDRVAAAIGEVHGRLAGCIASARQQVSALDIGPRTSSIRESPVASQVGVASDSEQRDRSRCLLSDGSSSGASSRALSVESSI